MSPPPRPYRDHLFVAVDPDALQRSASGLFLPDWQPGDRDATRATVVASPRGLGPERLLPFPGVDGRAYSYADLVQVPRPGDVVYLRPNTFRPELEYSQVEPAHRGVFLVALEQVLAVAGPAGPVPFQGLLFCAPYYAPAVRDVAGHPQAFGAGALAGVVVDAQALPVPFVQRVAAAGPPLRGQAAAFAPGDLVAVHRMLYAQHARRQQDEEDAYGRGRTVFEPPTAQVAGVTYALVPRQLVLATAHP